MNSPSDIGLALLAAGVCWVAACDEPPGHASPDDEPVTIRVDRPQTDYLYRDRRGRLRSAPRLRAIPPAYRGAVMVHHPDLQPRDAETVFVANLLDASLDQQLLVEPASRRDFSARSGDLRDARQLARLTAYTAREFAKLDPRSRRRAASERAERRFEELLPRLAEPDAGQTRDSTDAVDPRGGPRDDATRSPRHAPRTPPDR